MSLENGINLELVAKKYKGNVEIEDLLAIIKNDWEKLKQLRAEIALMQENIHEIYDDLLEYYLGIDTNELELEAILDKLKALEGK